MSEAKKAGTTLESIKVLPFYGSDTSKGGLEPREFFMKAEVFAATKGYKKALLEDKISPSWAESEDLSDEEKELLKKDDAAKHFLIHLRVAKPMLYLNMKNTSSFKRYKFSS